MKPKRVIRLLIGVALLVLCELLLDSSSVGVRKRWNKLKGRSER